MVVPGATTPPAATIPKLSTLAPSPMEAPIPTKELSSKVHDPKLALGPTYTLFPILTFLEP